MHVTLRPAYRDVVLFGRRKDGVGDIYTLPFLDRIVIRSARDAWSVRALKKPQKTLKKVHTNLWKVKSTCNQLHDRYSNLHKGDKMCKGAYLARFFSVENHHLSRITWSLCKLWHRNGFNVVFDVKVERPSTAPWGTPAVERNDDVTHVKCVCLVFMRHSQGHIRT